MANNLVAIEPKSLDQYEAAVLSAGGKLSPITSEVKALIWTDYFAPEALANLIRANPQLEWVQLPFAGVDAFADLLKLPVMFTSAKGAYREPVAEHALALALALGRKLPLRIKATRWGKSDAFSFYDRNVLIIGAGGIAEELISLLKPFRSKITVVRNNLEVSVAGATKTAGLDQLDQLIPEADLVVIACALTDATRGMFDYRRFQLFKKGSYLVNIARGQIMVSDDLLRALDEGLLAGAGTDVTDPEPLPAGHGFFGRSDLIVTPHTADTKEIVIGLFAKRVFHNVKAYLGQGQYLGVVDKDLGY